MSAENLFVNVWLIILLVGIIKGVWSATWGHRSKMLRFAEEFPRGSTEHFLDYSADWYSCKLRIDGDRFDFFARPMPGGLAVFRGFRKQTHFATIRVEQLCDSGSAPESEWMTIRGTGDTGIFVEIAIDDTIRELMSWEGLRTVRVQE